VKTEIAPPPPPGPGVPEPEVDRRRSHRITLVVLALSGIVGALWVLGPIFYAGHDDPTAIDCWATSDVSLSPFQIDNVGNEFPLFIAHIAMSRSPRRRLFCSAFHTQPYATRF